MENIETKEKIPVDMGGEKIVHKHKEVLQF